MGDAGLVLAANLKKASPAGELSILWAALWVVGALLLGAAMISFAKNYWRKSPVLFHLSASEELARYRVLYERGELSAEEFGRIEARLNARMKREMNLPATSPGEARDAGSPGVRTADRPLPPVGIPKPVDSPPGLNEANGVPPPPPADPTNPQS